MPPAAPVPLTLHVPATPPPFAYDSGSTGADGALCIGDKKRSPDGQSCVADPDVPTDNVVVTLPPSGILDYTVVYISYGSTLAFQRNAANTPVYLLASGDVEIHGVVDVSGQPPVCGYGTTYGASYAPAVAADVPVAASAARSVTASLAASAFFR